MRLVRKFLEKRRLEWTRTQMTKHLAGGSALPVTNPKGGGKTRDKTKGNPKGGAKGGKGEKSGRIKRPKVRAKPHGPSPSLRTATPVPRRFAASIFRESVPGRLPIASSNTTQFVDFSTKALARTASIVSIPMFKVRCRRQPSTRPLDHKPQEVNQKPKRKLRQRDPPEVRPDSGEEGAQRHVETALVLLSPVLWWFHPPSLLPRQKSYQDLVCDRGRPIPIARK